MNVLANKVAIITGASSGIGRAAAILFAQEGARVVVGARREAELHSLRREIEAAGGQAAVLAGDVKDEAYARGLVALAVRTFDGLDIAFNNAGTLGAGCAAPDMSVEKWNETLATNLTSAFLAAKHQVPAMLERGGGSIIFTSTFVGYATGLPGMADYAASKAGLVGLTRVLAAEYGPRRIRVNALLPGGVDTPMGRTAAHTPEAMAFVKNLHAMKRVAEPEEIAQSALYLASPASSFQTGTAMLVDGGISINHV